MTAGSPNKEENAMKTHLLSSPGGGRTFRSNFALQSNSVPSNYIYSLERPFLKLENRSTVLSPKNTKNTKCSL